MAKRKNLNTIPIILSTKDYSKFKFHHSNRPTPGPHVSAIMHEIQQNPNSIKYNPVLINKKGYIIDGQNRFKACVKLGLPIFYIQADDLSIADIPTLNRNQKSWSLNNYVHFFSSYHNKKDYKRIKALQKKYPISTGVISALLALGRNYRAIDHGFSKIYKHYLLTALKRNIATKFNQEQLLKKLNLSLKDLMLIGSFREFDNRVTSKLNEFKDAEDYYRKASSIYYLKTITKPALVLHAEDDPFMSPEIIPKDNQMSSSLELRVSSHGGHVGFVNEASISSASFFLEKTILDYFDRFL